jgi:acetolactate synthase-1/2/3 large subunit
LRRNYLEEQIPSPLGLDPRPYMKILNATLPEDAILTAGAGNYTSWHQRFHTYTTYPSQVSTQSGSMGYGLPAAIAAQLAQPDRKVVGFAGDGCLLMTGQELATAARYDARILIIVVNNGSYGTIRMHQEATFPGRVAGTDLVNPDFAAYARSFGIAAARVRTPAEFQDVLGDLLAVSGPALVEIVDDVDRFGTTAVR